VPAIEALDRPLGGPFAPDAFSPAQVAEGLFYGIELASVGLSRGRSGCDASLLAVAGTHLVAPAWGVAAALGNVYVHPAWRGRGYGVQVSSAVASDLLQRGHLVVLNVDQGNPAAIKLVSTTGLCVCIARRRNW
jgi:ribosomal protein S18 acetylase RimI-like enzyme